MQLVASPAATPRPFPDTLDPQPVTGPAAWAKQPLAVLDMRIGRLMSSGVDKQLTGRLDVLASTVELLPVTSLDHAVLAARELARTGGATMAVLQGTDGAFYATSARTNVSTTNPSYLNHRGVGNALRPEALDWTLQPAFAAGHHDYAVEATAASSEAGRALRALVTAKTFVRFA